MSQSLSPQPTIQDEKPFPWHLGLYDAHCHPTDTMGTSISIPDMKTRCLTVMATREQDQELVARLSDLYAHENNPETTKEYTGHVVPCFGWHPWFSYLMYDDTQKDWNQNRLEDKQEFKVQHYQSVLTPLPDDQNFIGALPEPQSLSEFLNQTRSYLKKYPSALIGEIGLDRAFRLPCSWTSDEYAQRDTSLTLGGREGRKLAPYRVSITHQKAILLAQLRLAGETNRAVSVHGVQAHGVVYETLKESWKGYEKEVLNKKQQKAQKRNMKEMRMDEENEEENNQELGIWDKPFPPRICLHSYSGPPDVLKEYFRPSIPTDMYFSFSSAVNLCGTETAASRAIDVIKALPEDRILVESDLHRAGQEMDRRIEEVTRKVCQAREWNIEEGVMKLGRNWKEFVFGRTDSKEPAK